MRKDELANLLVGAAKRYAQQEGGIAGSLIRNAHMHRRTLPVDEVIARAVVVDFVNSVAYKCGLDLGLYDADIEKETGA